MSSLARMQALAVDVADKPKTSSLGRVFELLEDQMPASVAVADWRELSPVDMFAGRGRNAPVGESLDLDRILALARRAPLNVEPEYEKNEPEVRALIDRMTREFGKRNPNCSCASLGRRCITRLNGVQAWALDEAPRAGGLLGNIGVGWGKTALNFLMPRAMQARNTVLLLPPNLVTGLIEEYKLWKEHFHMPSLISDKFRLVVSGAPTVHVIPFSQFCRAKSTALLGQLLPDLLEVDEGHRLKDKDTATTSRCLRYFVDHERCRLCVWSGTFTDKSIADYAHLIGIALREGSPLPIEPKVVESWRPALDPSDHPGPAGELRKLCARDETLYEGFHRRLVETFGVVSTRSGSCNASINILEREAPALPFVVVEHLNRLRETGARPDGEEFMEDREVAGCARELSIGGYHRWKYPRMEPEPLILEWLEIRKNMHREIRQALKGRAEHLDSPDLLFQAAMRFYGDKPASNDLPSWESQWWPEWKRIKEQVKPVSEWVWIDKFLAEDCADWVRKNKGVVWYDTVEFGSCVATLAGVRMHGGGTRALENLLAESGKNGITASIKSHGEGRDGMQLRWCSQLVASPPSSGKLWEQLLGRLHRPGQSADEVDTYVYRHTEEMMSALDRAVLRAKYIDGTMGNCKRLLAANCSFQLSSSD